VVAAALALLIAGLLYLLLHRTRIGKAIRAVAENREAAELNGIPTTQVLSFAFGLGVALAAVSGTLIATLFPFNVLSGGAYEVKSFVVTVLGGLGNAAGALMRVVALGLIGALRRSCGELDASHQFIVRHGTNPVPPRRLRVHQVLSR
jgi:branched-subunit amino acid ABC-type transport system permease component